MTEKKPTSTPKKWIIAGGIGLVALLGGYGVAYAVAGDKVPSNTTVEGVAIGGMSPTEAVAKLEAELGTRYTTSMTIADAEGRSIVVDPAVSGLTVDYEATVTAAGAGRSLNPGNVWRKYFGGSEATLVKNIDEAALTTALEGQAGVFATEGVDATLSFVDGEIARTESTPGVALDTAATATAVAEAWNLGSAKAEAKLADQTPTVTTAMVDEAITNWATPAMSAPVTVTVGDLSFEVTTANIAAVTTFAVENGALVPHVNPDQLLDVTAEARASLGLATGHDASYTLTDGQIQVVPAEDGQQVDKEAMAAGITEAATKQGAERTVSVGIVEGEAEFSTEEAEAVKPTQVIGEFTTKYPHAAYRNTNLGRAAELINGTVLMPGEIFSLNDALGPRTPANGFTDGYVIRDGALVKESGGGISQAATTIYNAGFFAGYEDVEHRPHTLYFPRYPAGREATIYAGAFDMRFRNDTEYPSYIEAYIVPSTSESQGSITFKIWSIPTWDKVESTEPVKSDFYSGTDRVLNTPDCEPQAPIQGFTATWQRLFYKNGEVVKTEDYMWKYSAGDRITCAPAEEG